MVRVTSSNIFGSTSEYLVCPCNTVGVMEGIGTIFEARFPEEVAEYKLLCEDKKVTIGDISCIKLPEKSQGVIFFPINLLPGEKSDLSIIAAGLMCLREFVKQTKVKSLSMTAIGAGEWGLSSEDVKLRITHSFPERTNVITIHN